MPDSVHTPQPHHPLSDCVAVTVLGEDKREVMTRNATNLRVRRKVAVNSGPFEHGASLGPVPLITSQPPPHPSVGPSCTVSLFFLLTTWHLGSEFPGQGSSLCPLNWKVDVLTTGPPGNSLSRLSCHLLHPDGPRMFILSDTERFHSGAPTPQVHSSSPFASQNKQIKKSLI